MKIKSVLSVLAGIGLTVAACLALKPARQTSFTISPDDAKLLDAAGIRVVAPNTTILLAQPSKPTCGII